jgi:hypothetical protein
MQLYEWVILVLAIIDGMIVLGISAMEDNA